MKQREGDYADFVESDSYRALDTGTAAITGTTAAMTAGAVTITTTAATATAKILYSRTTTGGTVGHVSLTRSAGVSFTLTSSSNTETSTFSWFIVEAAADAD